MDELPYLPKNIQTPAGHYCPGKELNANICGVEIIRAGGAMRTSFSRIFVDAPIGKILIQTSEIGEPLVCHSLCLLTQLHFVKLPHNLPKYHIIVMVSILILKY